MFGQYSQGNARHTKRDMVRFAEDQGYEIETAKKGGHNRLDFTTLDGRRCFMLHSTVIAELSSDGLCVTLNDGGWATMTTRRAMNEALDLFGLQASLWAAGSGLHELWGHTFQRTATFSTVNGRIIEKSSDPYLLRATVTNDVYGGVEVTYDGKRIKSKALGRSIPIEPWKLIALLRRIKAECRLAGGRMVDAYTSPGHSYRAATKGFTPSYLGGQFHICAEWPGSVVYIGCHAFKAQDISGLLKRLEQDYPESASRTRKSDGRIKKSPAWGTRPSTALKAA